MTMDIVDELKAFSVRVFTRLKLDPDVAVLAATTRLAHKLAFNLDT